MPGRIAKENSKVLDKRPSAALAKKEDGSKVTQGDGFSMMSLLPVFFMVNMVILLTVCCIWYGPQKVMRTTLLYFLPPNPDPWHVWTIWFAIVGLIVMAIPESPIIHFLMALPSMLVGFWIGTLVAATAEWFGKILCFTIGRSFAQRPVRQFLMSTQSPRVMRMLGLLEDPDEQSLYLLILWHFLPVGPLKTYGLAVLDVPLSKLAITLVPQGILISLLLSTIGMSFKVPAQSLRDGKQIELMSSWDNIVLVLIMASAFFLFTWIATRAYQQKAEQDAEASSLRGAEEGVGDSTRYGTSSSIRSENLGY